MILFPNAKINLGLNIVHRRDDGFHDIESCFLPINLCDVLEFLPNEKETTFVSSGIDIPGVYTNNLCIKAWRLFKADFDIPPVKIHLHKQIPIGAGLGGGSSDGAYMLKGLNNLFKLGLTDTELENYALNLGSDCVFFIKNKSAFVEGRGEKLSLIDIKVAHLNMILVNPGVHINTSEAYSKIRPEIPENPIPEILKLEVAEWKTYLKNDFEESVFAKTPEVKQIKEKMYQSGAIYASMSGSGSTVFGLFDGEIPRSLKSDFSDLFVWQQSE